MVCFKPLWPPPGTSYRVMLLEGFSLSVLLGGGFFSGCTLTLKLFEILNLLFGLGVFLELTSQFFHHLVWIKSCPLGKTVWL